MGDNYAEKQHTRQSGMGNIVHNPKPNGCSTCRTVRVDGTASTDQRSRFVTRNQFWNDILGDSIKKILKKGE